MFLFFSAFVFAFYFFQRSRFTVNSTPTPPSPQILLSLKASRYSLPYDLAMNYSGATVSERAMRRRVERFFERQEFENGVESGGGDAVPSPDLSTTPPRDPTSKYYPITKARKQAIDKIPDWMSKRKPHMP